MEKSNEPFPPGTLVKFETDRFIVVGTVTRIIGQASARYRYEIEVDPPPTRYERFWLANEVAQATEQDFRDYILERELVK